MDEMTDSQFKKPKMSSTGLKRNARLQRRKHKKRALEKMRAVVPNNAIDKPLVDVVNCSDFKSRQSPQEIMEEIKLISNARERSKVLFEWLIKPIGMDRFFKEYWEKRALVIQRSQSDYFTHLFSSTEFDTILNNDSIEYSVNLDVTQYQEGRRETLNPEGRAYPSVVWKYYADGCSLRLLNPQTYSHSLWWLNATLQDYFRSFVGANMYLTPANSQGFAPHYDDIEAFILQIEGEKHWKLHPPRNDNEILPRESSGYCSILVG